MQWPTFVAAATACLPGAVAVAAKVHGRVEAGALASTERFTTISSGSDKNDTLVSSGRFYLGVSEIGEARWEFKMDVRDKYDFFDKLNREQLQLDAKNSFQVREMHVRQPVHTASGWGYSLGRFSVTEAGTFTDGALIKRKFASRWNLAAFGGLNPKVPGETYLELNSDTSLYGGYVSFQRQGTSWEKNFYATHAYVNQTENSLVDRRYLFHNMSYQWAQNSRLITFLYLDFVPRTYVQQGSLFWQQELTQRLYTKMSLLGVDVVEYAHLQNVRERLAASPYKQGSLRFDIRASPLTTIEFGTLVGKRESDHLSKTDSSVSIASQRTFGPKWETRATVGYRDNFASKDQYARVGLGYFSRHWESDLSVEGGVEKYDLDGDVRHPLITELAFSRFFSETLFATLSLQRAADEQVTIMTSFFKLGYRFGNREIPPLRDGAPARGSL